MGERSAQRAVWLAGFETRRPRGADGNRMSVRRRRMLAAGLRRAGGTTRSRRPFTLLLAGRCAEVVEELLRLADLVESVVDPTPDWVQAVDDLLTDGCNSPLYNQSVHISELRATLFYLARPHDPVWGAPESSEPEDVDLEDGALEADPRLGSVVPLRSRSVRPRRA
jgi:hypothetical protein